MLKSRPEQLEVFEPVAERFFESRVMEYLREEHGDEVVLLPTGELLIEELHG